MTKQILKGVWAVSLTAALAAISVPATAEPIEVNVPFAFTVGGKTLESGAYQVHPGAARNTLFIRSPRAGAIVLTQAAASGKNLAASLVFHKYGDQYILREVWLGKGDGHQVPASREERKLAQAARGGKVAGLERVVVPVR